MVDEIRPPAFIAYYRVSIAREKGPGLGIEAQRVAIASFVESLPDATLLAEFAEIASGRGPATKILAERPQLAAALDAAGRQKATLLVASVDRLARNLAFVARLLENGPPFIAVDTPHAGPFMLQIHAVLAEEEHRQIVRRCRAAALVRYRRHPHSGNPAFPRMAREAAEAANARAEALRSTIETLRAEGVRGLRAMTRALNERGVTTVKGDPWGHTSVRTLLRRLDGSYVSDRADQMKRRRERDPFY